MCSYYIGTDEPNLSITLKLCSLHISNKTISTYILNQYYTCLQLLPCIGHSGRYLLILAMYFNIIKYIHTLINISIEPVYYFITCIIVKLRIVSEQHQYKFYILSGQPCCLLEQMKLRNW